MSNIPPFAFQQKAAPQMPQPGGGGAFGGQQMPPFSPGNFNLPSFPGLSPPQQAVAPSSGPKFTQSTSNPNLQAEKEQTMNLGLHPPDRPVGALPTFNIPPDMKLSGFGLPGAKKPERTFSMNLAPMNLPTFDISALAKKDAKNEQNSEVTSSPNNASKPGVGIPAFPGFQQKPGGIPAFPGVGPHVGGGGSNGSSSSSIPAFPGVGPKTAGGSNGGGIPAFPGVGPKNPGGAIPAFPGVGPQVGGGGIPAFPGVGPQAAGGSGDGGIPAFPGSGPKMSGGAIPAFPGVGPQVGGGGLPAFPGVGPQVGAGGLPAFPGVGPKASGGGIPAFSGVGPQASGGGIPPFPGSGPKLSGGGIPAFPGVGPQAVGGGIPPFPGAGTPASGGCISSLPGVGNQAAADIPRVSSPHENNSIPQFLGAGSNVNVENKASSGNGMAKTPVFLNMPPQVPPPAFVADLPNIAPPNNAMLPNIPPPVNFAPLPKLPSTIPDADRPQSKCFPDSSKFSSISRLFMESSDSYDMDENDASDDDEKQEDVAPSSAADIIAIDDDNDTSSPAPSELPPFQAGASPLPFKPEERVVFIAKPANELPPPFPAFDSLEPSSSLFTEFSQEEMKLLMWRNEDFYSLEMPNDDEIVSKLNDTYDPTILYNLMRSIS